MFEEAHFGSMTLIAGSTKLDRLGRPWIVIAIIAMRHESHDGDVRALYRRVNYNGEMSRSQKAKN